MEVWTYTPRKNWNSLGRDNSFPVFSLPQKREIIWFKPKCSLGMVLIIGEVWNRSTLNSILRSCKSLSYTLIESWAFSSGRYVEDIGAGHSLLTTALFLRNGLSKKDLRQLILSIWIEFLVQNFTPSFSRGKVIVLVCNSVCTVFWSSIILCWFNLSSHFLFTVLFYLFQKMLHK